MKWVFVTNVIATASSTSWPYSSVHFKPRKAYANKILGL